MDDNATGKDYTDTTGVGITSCAARTYRLLAMYM